MIHLVAYDLHEPGRSYDEVIEVLESADASCHPQGSVWFLDTLRDPVDWCNALKAASDQGDEFFVVKLTKNWASWAMDDSAVEWLKSGERRW